MDLMKIAKKGIRIRSIFFTLIYKLIIEIKAKINKLMSMWSLRIKTF